MRNNPVVPYILIMVFGIGLIFFLSLHGTGNKEEIAADKNGDAATEESASDDGAALVQACTACHGGDLKGNIGPNLIGQDPDHIVEVLTKGIEGTPMTPGMKSEAEAKQIAEYISSLK